MKKKILVILMLSIMMLTTLYGVTRAMGVENTLNIKALPIKKISEPPQWSQKYLSFWMGCVGSKNTNGLISASNPQKTAMFQITSTSDGEELSVVKNGKTWKIMSENLGFGLFPVWNSNGTAFAIEQITMVNEDLEVEGNIYVVRIDGEDKPVIELVAKEVFGSPLTWSYSGDKLVFANYEEIYIYSLKYSKLTQVAKAYGSRAGYPARSGSFLWSPDDNQIVLSYWRLPQIDIPDYYVISNVNSLFP